MTGQQLKNSILQAAVQGKLVSQNTSDTPSSIFLSKIQKEKDRLVKSGALKKDRVLNPILEEDKPFDIPQGWSWIRLGDYCERITDQVASGSFASLRENVKSLKVPSYAIMVKTADFANGFTNNLTYTDEHGYHFLENSNLYGGELILSNIGSIGKVFVVPKLNMPMTLAPNSVMIRLMSEEQRDYLYWFLLSPQGYEELMSITSGTAMKKFNKTDLKTILVPVPPIEEQKRIVAKIEELFPLVDEYDKAAGELKVLNESLPDKLRKSVLQEAIHGTLVPNDIPDGEATAQELLQQILKERQDRENKEKGKKAKKLTLSTIEEEPWELPEGWCWCKLQDIIDFTSSGTTKNQNISPDSWILDLEDIEKETGRLLCKKRFGEIKSLSDKRSFKKGNVLYSKLRPYLNKCIIANEDGYCTTEILAFDFDPIYNRYAQSFLMSPFFVDRVNQGSAGVKMPRVNNAEANDTCFPLPPLSIQHRIVEKIEELFSTINTL